MTEGEQGEPLWFADDALRHLDVLFDWWDQPGGWIKVAFRRENEGTPRDWWQTAYQWPEHVPVLLAHAGDAVARGLDVYLAPNLFTVDVDRDRLGDGQVRGTDAQLRPMMRCVHLDIDEQRDADAVDRLREAGALLVGSGTTGHVHSYVLLPYAASLEELRGVAGRMKVALGLDKVQAPSHVLRLAGTANFKRRNGGTPVRILNPSSDGQVSPDALSALTDDGSERVVPISAARQRQVGGDYSRSHAAYQLWCSLWEDGYEPQEAYFRAVAAAHDEGDLYHRWSQAAVAKYGDGDGLRRDAERCMLRRAYTASGSDIKMRADERARRQREGLL